MLEAHVFSIPMTTRFRGITTRDGVLLRGPAGWAEVSPFWDYDAAESANWLRAGLDSALNGFPTAVRDSIPVNVTVPAVDAETAYRIVATSGCRTAKVKVAEPGQALSDDVARVEAVRAAMAAGPGGADAKVRIDVNGKWDVETALASIPVLDRAAGGLEYVEQPCASIAELAEVRRRIKHMGIPITADESVRRAEDPLAVARAGAADIIVIKAQPLGGLHRALAIVAEAGLPAVVSSAVDTSIGLSMGAALAAALPSLDYDCGLGTSSLFVEDIAVPAVRPVNGKITVGRVEPDPARLDALAAPADRRDWWMSRLERCHAVLAAASTR